MDGHDNDENKNLGGSTQQGIFSTPELTVDTEKLAQSAEATKEASRAKIASIFANTETGQQAQKLNDAMEANMAPATEDIVIDNGGKKKKKWLIVAAVLALVAAAGGVGAWFLMQNLGGQTKETPLEAFNKYVQLAKDGPENKPVIDEEAGGAITPSDKWFLRSLSNANLQRNEAEDYLKDLINTYSRFYELYGKSDNANMTLANKYTNMLNIYIDLHSLTSLAHELASKYLNDSPNAAYSYIQDFSDDENMIPLEEDGIGQLKNYLEAELSMLSISEANNCIANNTLDESCRANLAETSEAYQESLRAQQRASQNMATISNALGKLLQDQAPILQKEIENEN